MNPQLPRIPQAQYVMPSTTFDDIVWVMYTNGYSAGRVIDGRRTAASPAELFPCPHNGIHGARRCDNDINKEKLIMEGRRYYERLMTPSSHFPMGSFVLTREIDIDRQYDFNTGEVLVEDYKGEKIVGKKA